MTVKELTTEIALLKQDNKNHDILHVQIMEQFKDDRTQNQKEHKDLFNAVNEIKSSIDRLPEKLDNRYASKATEINQKKMVWLVVSTVVITTLALILKK